MTESDEAARLEFEVLTLFPAAIDGFVAAGLLGKAIDKGLVSVRCTDFRDFTSDKHRTVDDAPFGGGAGMVIKPEPVVAAIEAVEAERGPMHKVLLTPSAPRFDQAAAERLVGHRRIALLCGRYEGIDDRVREHWVDECLSIGDFVLGGGEVAALVVIEAVSRLHEGVLGNPASLDRESFVEPGRDPGQRQLLEHPQYTRPAEFRGHAVPAVLLSGNHAAIEAWRLEQARTRTWALRPDLRTDVRLHEQTPIHVAFSAQAEVDEAILAIAREGAVSGLVLLGTDVDASMGWVRAAAGRPAVVTFANLGQVRKRLRRGTAAGLEPWVVAVLPEGATHPRAVDDPCVLLDGLGVAEAPADRPLVLWFPGPRAVESLTEGSKGDRHVDALFAGSSAAVSLPERVANALATLRPKP